MNDYYVVNVDDEDLSVAILAGPLSLSDAQDKMHKKVVEWLEFWGVADNENEAEEMYQKALNREPLEEENPLLHVGKRSASIVHGGGYEDRYQIIQYVAES